jgi:hypothetical protein
MKYNVFVMKGVGRSTSYEINIEGNLLPSGL